MRDLSEAEIFMVSGAGDNAGTLTVSAETFGSTVGGLAGGYLGGPAGGAAGALVGGAVTNYLQGTRDLGSVGASGIPWGASNGGGQMWGPSSGS